MSQISRLETKDEGVIVLADDATDHRQHRKEDECQDVAAHGSIDKTCFDKMIEMEMMDSYFEVQSHHFCADVEKKFHNNKTDDNASP